MPGDKAQPDFGRVREAEKYNNRPSHAVLPPALWSRSLRRGHVLGMRHQAGAEWGGMTACGTSRQAAFYGPTVANGGIADMAGPAACPAQSRLTHLCHSARYLAVMHNEENTRCCIRAICVRGRVSCGFCSK